MDHFVTRLGNATGHLLYGVYGWALFVPTILFAAGFASILPGLHRRRRWVRATARLFFLFSGMRPTINGLEQLPEDHCIVVANHASYLDGMILQAFLPARFAYVIKGEVRNIALVHFLLRRIGAKFVERFVTSGSIRDARKLVKAAASGESLAFFPEGTVIVKPGLGRFHAGAFSAALKGGLPIVPVSIRGSRRILPARTLLPFPGKLRIDILTPLETNNAAAGNSSELAERARQSILSVLDEPDLLQIETN